jgi:DNA topoisomerase-2
VLPGRTEDGKSVEEIYQKKTQLEHILLRPDTYIGSVEHHQQAMWVYDEAAGCMVSRTLSFVPGLFKIFDEILVNAADNKIRDPGMDTLKVDIDKENGSISIYNNGKGIPIEMHGKEKVWVPELIFGHLLTSSNYDDTQKKVVGGRNGYGAKLCNIFSTQFVVETGNAATGRKYRQVFSHNMSKRGEPSITSWAKEDFTRITFTPDFAKFGMAGIDADTEALFKKRVYDMCGVVKNIKVFLNGERLKVKNFRQYVELFLKKPAGAASEDGLPTPATPPLPTIIHEQQGERWEVCCALSDGQFQQVSFVNSINTYKGGTHVNYIADQIVAHLVEAVKRKSKDMAGIKPFQVRNHLSIFLNCLVENPTFDSQTKENLTLRASAFGSRCELGEDFMRKVLKSGVLENVMAWARAKQDLALKKTDGAKRSRLSGIAKLDDANNAGGRLGHRCTLILTEGDSAKALAVSGLSVVGRDYYGVFPLRGKLLNVREASHKQIMENAEITAIKQILGLQQGREYASTESLRYGHLMIMTDQDHDGSHIKGLLINFLDHFWPSLMRIPGFLVEFITPIVRATRGRQEIAFYTIPEYERWKAGHEDGRGWAIKYYKVPRLADDHCVSHTPMHSYPNRVWARARLRMQKSTFRPWTRIARSSGWRRRRSASWWTWPSARSGRTSARTGSRRAPRRRSWTTAPPASPSPTLSTRSSSSSPRPTMCAPSRA